MQDFTKHLFAFCAAVLIAGGSFNAVTTVPAHGAMQPQAAAASIELA
tara:strand:+ start:590 stop:730 length:141 start_codon:yes stop_codon:yes gene_type:complete